jgi:hypothetical protein
MDSQRFTEEAVDFQRKVMWFSGLGNHTYLPPCERSRHWAVGQLPVLTWAQLRSWFAACHAVTGGRRNVC